MLLCYKRVRPARRTIIHPRHFSTSGVMAWRTVSMASSRRIQLAETSRLERWPVGWRLDSRQCRKQTRQRRDSLSLARSNGTIEAPRHFACPWAVSMRCLHGQILTEAEEREREKWTTSVNVSNSSSSSHGEWALLLRPTGSWPPMLSPFDSSRTGCSSFRLVQLSLNAGYRLLKDGWA